MSQALPKPSQVVGLSPWLPWPLSAWSWCVTPVRAERLAVLRIGVAMFLMWDVACNYAPETLAYFGPHGLGEPALFDWYFRAHRMNWSLLRGLGHEAGLHLALLTCILTTLWILTNSLGRLLLVRAEPPPQDRTGAALMIWSFAFAWYVGAVWTHMLDTKAMTPFAWVLPLFGFSLACLFFALDLAQRLRDTTHRIAWFSSLFSFGVVGVLIAVGCPLAGIEEVDPNVEWARYLRSWQNDEQLIVIAMGVWLGSAFLLLIGCGTRFSAIATWVMSMSFANANHYLDNAGDTVRLILLFYLMLCPCGAVWSVDALVARRRGPIYIYPWPIRLIFVQMIFMYFMNGLYKLFSDDWPDGVSIYYVLGDATFTRFSQVALPLPFVLTQIMTWTVLAWELLFPFMMVFKWTRRLTLAFGVMFHLGILATMELGPFVPYALCMYLPLLPWECLSRRREEEGEPVVEIVES